MRKLMFRLVFLAGCLAIGQRLKTKLYLWCANQALIRHRQADAYEHDEMLELSRMAIEFWRPHIEHIDCLGSGRSQEEAHRILPEMYQICGLTASKATSPYCFRCGIQMIPAQSYNACPSCGATAAA